MGNISYNFTNKNSSVQLPKTHMTNAVKILQDANENKQHPAKFAKKLKRLTKQYNEQLIRLGIGKTYNELMKNDIIDVRPILPKQDTKQTLKLPPTDKNLMDYVFKTGWTAHIPCLTKATIIVNDCRFWDYEVTDIDVENQMVRIYVNEYVKTEDDVWEIGTKSYGRLTFSKDNTAETVHADYTLDDNDVYSSADYYILYSFLKRKNLGWSKDDYDIWKNTVIKNAANAKHEFDKQNNSGYNSLMQLFLNVTTLINKTLHDNKMSRPVRSSHTKTVTANTKIEHNKQDAPERVTRYVGGISIKSEKPARVPTEKSIIRYTMASWPTRGFTRHYKSGKVVYIKPSVHHRHCMKNDKNDNTIKQTIIVRNEKNT